MMLGFEHHVRACVFVGSQGLFNKVHTHARIWLVFCVQCRAHAQREQRLRINCRVHAMRVASLVVVVVLLYFHLKLNGFIVVSYKHRTHRHIYTQRTRCIYLWPDASCEEKDG